MPWRAATTLNTVLWQSATARPHSASHHTTSHGSASRASLRAHHGASGVEGAVTHSPVVAVPLDPSDALILHVVELRALHVELDVVERELSE
eukprot:11059233-Heterocapsa_arctica.AAC.1